MTIAAPTSEEPFQTSRPFIAASMCLPPMSSLKDPVRALFAGSSTRRYGFPIFRLEARSFGLASGVGSGSGVGVGAGVAVGSGVGRGGNVILGVAAGAGVGAVVAGAPAEQAPTTRIAPSSEAASRAR